MSGDADELDVMLARAGRALRDETSGESERAQRTRARVLASRRAQAQRTAWAMAAAAVLAIGLGAPTVWAWSTGRLAEWLGGGEGAETETEAERETEAVVAEPEVIEPAVVEPEVVEPEVVEPEVVEPEPRLAPPSEPEVEMVASDPRPAPSRELEIVDPAERRAYREAHALHFEARDWDGAIGAWQRYLDAYPRGRFALEAKYNRALCLVRLGRRDEARRALEEFAQGEHGSYRQHEATRLLEAMDE